MDQNIIAEPSDSREKKTNLFCAWHSTKKLGYLFMKKILPIMTSLLAVVPSIEILLAV